LIGLSSYRDDPSCDDLLTTSQLQSCYKVTLKL